MRNIWGFECRRNTVSDIVSYLKKSNFKSESEIQLGCWGYDRSSSRESNKKYAELLRRAWRKGLIDRTEVEGKKHKFVYYI